MKVQGEEIVVKMTVLDVTGAADARLATALLRTLQGSPLGGMNQSTTLKVTESQKPYPGKPMG
jgi:hypothetical protein